MASVVHRFIEESLKGSVSPFIAYLADSRSLSNEELARLKVLVPGLDPAEMRMAAVSVLMLGLTLLGCRMLLAGRFGMLMIAARDDEVRLRTLGYETLRLKLVVWCLSALIAALAGMLYVPQVGIINPRLLAPELSLEIAVWVAIGGRGHLVGAVIGAVLVNAVKFWLSVAAPELWPFILSGLIVLVVLVFPNGLVDLAKLKLVRPTGLKHMASGTPELR